MLDSFTRDDDVRQKSLEYYTLVIRNPNRNAERSNSIREEIKETESILSIQPYIQYMQINK